MLILTRVDEKALLSFTRLRRPFSTTRRLAPFVREQALWGGVKGNANAFMKEVAIRTSTRGAEDTEATWRFRDSIWEPGREIDYLRVPIERCGGYDRGEVQRLQT